MYRREGKQISRGDRQGASSKRANSSVAEHGRIWQVACPGIVILPPPFEKAYPQALFKLFIIIQIVIIIQPFLLVFNLVL